MRVPTLASDDIVLRPWDGEDAAWYVGARDEHVLAWTREAAPLTVAEAAAGFAAIAADPRRGAFAIADATSGDLLGNVGISLHDDTVELSYWVAAAARGRGVASAALATAAFWAANALGRDTLELVTHPENAASQRVAENAGFTATGIRRACDSCADANGMVAHYERRIVRD